MVSKYFLKVIFDPKKGLFHYRDQITRGLTDSDSFLLLNSDVCSLYPLKEMMKIHNESGKIATILCVKSEVIFYTTQFMV